MTKSYGAEWCYKAMLSWIKCTLCMCIDLIQYDWSILPNLTLQGYFTGDCPSSSEETLIGMGKYTTCIRNITKTKHNKNHVHILWDILWVYVSVCAIIPHHISLTAIPADFK